MSGYGVPVEAEPRLAFVLMLMVDVPPLMKRPLEIVSVLLPVSLY